ncbi:tRNA (adenosine(37)-N6)-threonylcarbamoyltransferase complex transferase subunit TsaD [Dactylosporangium sp. NPDC049140]|uniref:tRNA (adenosine(37)-N6)-threonylcarbamoyltransferase complex transferase subunit TsaD n=1 Tax=Dactylosporangium sp. NPDC049140 TaxID=3155647 RepID=UPI0033DE85AC
MILGIATPYDATAVALVGPDGEVVAESAAAQWHVHARYGGVVPRLAGDEHRANILPAVRTVIDRAGADPRTLTAIGVARGPGLIGSLRIGLDTAAALGLGWQVPVFGVNQLRGRVRSAELGRPSIRYPALILLVSGGQTLLAHMPSIGEIAVIGQTRDDAIGDAYEKVARRLGLGYPGGPAVDRAAQSGSANVPLPRPLLNKGFDFSFSGLKSAVMRQLHSSPEDLCASFVAACTEVLSAKTRRALRAYPAESLVVVGGVAASPQLRAAARELSADAGIELCLPPRRWCTTNAAMTAMTTWDYLAHDIQPLPVPSPRLSIASW